MDRPLSFLCITCYLKGQDFLRACKAAGNTVYLLTAKKLEHADWPRDAVDEFFYLASDENTPENFDTMERGLAWLMRSKRIDRIVSLDDFDVEKAAYLREAFRIPGMGQTTARHFRDKLAMRMKAEEAGINVPPFAPLFNDEVIHEYTQRVAPPWVVKPRAEASATGIKKVHSSEELWAVLESLGGDRHRYLVEQFKPGDVYHADALTVDGKNTFCRISKYLDTPFEVAHGGGIFRSATVPFGGEEDEALQALNAKVMKAFGMRFSASHTEFIRAKEDGKYYFLETSSRVGGAHLAEMVEYSSGINLWAEWARLETAMAKGHAYEVPTAKKDHAGIIVSLSRFEHPDDSSFADPEVVWRLHKPYHIGMILRSGERKRVLELLDQYAERIHRDFHASAPAPDKPHD
jgi:biotin carboxylase